MATEQFIVDNLIGKDVLISYGNDGEWINFADSTKMNREFLCGKIESVESGVIVLITKGGTAYISASAIEAIFPHDFKYNLACSMADKHHG